MGRKGEAGAPLVSVIIVLYNSADYIGPCLRSLAGLEYVNYELILVDNGSEDGSSLVARKAAEEAGVDCVISRLESNSGFAKANNLGFGLSTGEIVLLLNPDTEVFPDTLDMLVRSFEDESVGIAGCKLYYPDRKTIQHAGGFIRDNGLTMHYGVGEEDRGQFDEVRDVMYVTGAALAVRRGVFTRVGMLDTGYYPAYFEEADLCTAVRRLGRRVVYYPAARVIHHESTTTGKFTEKYYYLYHRNRIRFLLKNFSLGFLLERALPMEERWLGMIAPEEQSIPLNKAYLANIAMLPLTLAARLKNDRLLEAPRLEDTVGEL